MMKYKVSIHKKDETQSVIAEGGDILLDILRDNGILMDTPCGGKGTCGKCAVIVSGTGTGLSESERVLLGREKLEIGYRLACRYHIASDVEVYTEGASAEAAIITSGIRRDICPEPYVKKEYIELSLPSLEDQQPHLERVLSAAHLSAPEDAAEFLRDLPSILKASRYKITAVSAGGKMLSAEPGNTAGRLFGMAFDIGTTTVAAYLYDLNSGAMTAVGSALNPQRRYGADVISRISHAKQSLDNANEMKNLIIGCINELTMKLAFDAGIDPSEIYTAVFSGNTTMLHFLAGFDTSGLAVSPFIPVTCSIMQFNAEDSGIIINKRGIVTMLPCVSAYVGADAVAAIQTSGMYEKDDISLLVDIGTNGEVVLGGKNWLIACSTAAGPAFEGANIRHGMGGVSGAVDSFSKDPDDFKYTVLGHTAPKGICGSGLIDAIAVLLDSGAIDETGRLAGEQDGADLPSELTNRLKEIDDMKTFIIVPKCESGIAEPITITQKDIRELQNAKAAIAAGIDTLIDHSGIGYNSIKRVYLAGGFGSSIHTASAARVGLLPGILEDRVETIGNASGSGAAESLLSADMLRVSEEIAGRVKYVELSASAYFNEKYVDRMMFEGN